MHEIYIKRDPVPAPRPRVTKNGTYHSQEYTDYRNALKLEMLRYWSPMAPLDGPITLHLAFHMPVPASLTKAETARRNGAPHIARPDVDNLAKSVMDAGNGLLWGDDSQISELLITKVWCNADQPAGIGIYFDNDWLELDE